MSYFWQQQIREGQKSERDGQTGKGNNVFTDDLRREKCISCEGAASEGEVR